MRSCTVMDGHRIRLHGGAFPLTLLSVYGNVTPLWGCTVHGVWSRLLGGKPRRR